MRKNLGRTVLGWLVGVFFVLLLISIGKTGNLFAQSFGVNLLVNPDAETGSMEGWVDPDNIWGADAPVTPHGGNYLFWPSRGATAYTKVYQDVNVTPFAATIDAGQAYCTLSGWMANWDQYPHDRATLAIQALDASGNELFYGSRSHRSPTWGFYEMTNQIPPGTRTLRVYLIATRFVGTDDDGYFDDLSLLVTNTAPTVVVTVSSVSGATSVAVDSTLQLQAQTTGATDAGYTWSSSFEAVATVDSTGLVTAHQPGNVTAQAIGKSSQVMGSVRLVVYAQNSVIFVSPASGESWLAGSEQTISWQVKGTVDSGTLYWSFTGGSDWNEIGPVANLSSGSFTWTVPDSSRSLNDCVLKMTWSGGEATSAPFSIVPVALGVTEEKETHPSKMSLAQNYPNPFNSETAIVYSIPLKMGTVHVKLDVFNLMGQKVAALVNGVQNPGQYRVRFDASRLKAGIYAYRLKMNGRVQVRKMIYLK